MMEWSVYETRREGHATHLNQIDSVFFTDACDAHYVLKALIDHDGYAGDIQIQPVEPDAWPCPLGLVEVEELQDDGELYENWVDKANRYLPETGSKLVDKWKKQIGIPV